VVPIKDKEYYVGLKPWRLIDMFVRQACFSFRYYHVIILGTVMLYFEGCLIEFK
jgi:hypothetical protein